MKTLLLYLSLCVVGAWIPLRTASTPPPGPDAFPGWASAPFPLSAVEVPPGPRDARFAAGFPGRVGAFSDGTRSFVVRWVSQPTRKLHPAADCLRAVGYEVRPAPILAAPDGTRWGGVQATRDGATLHVRERIVDADGREWTDVSAWFWHASLGRSSGPWWAITLFEPAGAKR